MRPIRDFALFILLFALALPALAGHVSETVSLSAGWNAVYLESTPDDPSPAAFFADLPQVERIGCYESSVYSALAQIASDGTSIAQKPAAFLVWERGKDSSSTLQRILGGRVYFVYSTAAGTKTFYGVPACPRTTWQESGSGFATLAGVSIPAGETVSSLAYFREGPLGVDAAKKPHSVGGTAAAAPQYTQFMAFRGSPTLKAGGAYAFEAESVSDWPGVVRVSVPNASGALSFTSASALQSMTVANAGTTSRVVRVSYGASELESERKPPLKLFIPATATNASAWVDFTTHDFSLEAGASVQLAMSIDRTKIDAEGGEYAALVTVADLSGTKMRVRVPVTASSEAEGEANAAYPKGLWYGNIELSQVDHMSDGAPVAAGGAMRLNAMVFVDGSSTPKLMQRVSVGGRRFSAVFPDMAHNELAATSGTFGNLVQFDWVVAADAKDNPFRHAWHPDHGTGFDVTNRLALAWRTEKGDSTWEYTPEEVTYGICTWTLGGLSGRGDITMRGTFALRRILPVTKLEE